MDAASTRAKMTNTKCAHPDNQKFEKGGENDITGGPLKNRGCTDILCLILFVVHWAVLISVTFLGVADGNPHKLYRPRDYQGDYCGLAVQWNEGPTGRDLSDYAYQTFTMNVSANVEENMEAFMCSTAVTNYLSTIYPATEDRDTYLCNCCNVPCKTCTGSKSSRKNYADDNSLVKDMKIRMSEMTTGSTSYFSPLGANGDFYSKVWADATSYMNPVCAKECNFPNVANSTRYYDYVPPPDSPFRHPWKLLSEHASIPAEIKNTMKSHFRFKAIPEEFCPYHDRYCVPQPGAMFEHLSVGYCTFKMNADVVDAVGSTAAEAFETVAAEQLAGNLIESAGSWAGTFIETLDAFAITATLCFVIGLLFLVMLRFFVGICVWLTIIAIWLVFVITGIVMVVASGQCKESSLLDSGTGNVVALGGAVQAAADGAVEAYNAGDTPDLWGRETYSGNGQDYRGAQKYTRSGKACQKWSDTSPHSHSYTRANYPTDGLVGSYCRNPGGLASQIWCLTTDTDTYWESCSPLGVIMPDCPEGYAIDSETARNIIFVFAFIFFFLALIWFCVIFCIRHRIYLAISVNQVAAMFVYTTPTVVLVPIAQVVFAIMWTLTWALSASFILSQVPDGHTSTDYYATYQQAYGDGDTVGMCRDSIPAGIVWHDEGNDAETNNPCSGELGVVEQYARCWRCTPPRYMIDARFFLSLLSFFWNSAFLIGLGQLIIAGACGVWFFTPRQHKGGKRAVTEAIHNCVRYHLGSIAFGSLILAIVRLIRLSLSYLAAQAELEHNRVVVVMLQMVSYLIWCFEKCVKFLTKNAYIQVALLGKSFCPAAKAAYFLLIRNMIRFGVVAFLGTIVYVIGIIFIVAVSTFLGYLVLRGLHPSVSPVVPCVIYIITSYIVAKLFMNVFGLSTDTMLHAYIATEEMGGDTGFVPGPLQHMLAEKGVVGKE